MSDRTLPFQEGVSGSLIACQPTEVAGTVQCDWLVGIDRAERAGRRGDLREQLNGPPRIRKIREGFGFVRQWHPPNRMAKYVPSVAVADQWPNQR